MFKFTGCRDKPLIIPVFIPHLGCLNQCAFCNQRVITGVKEPDPESIDKVVKDYLRWSKPRERVEVSFFGGSFTAIDRDLMIRYVKKGRELIEKGVASSLRCSTRPDAVNDNIIGILKENGFETVEVGAQSLSDKLLKKMNRDHTVYDIASSVSILKKNKIKAGIQLIVGYPYESEFDMNQTILKLSSISLDFIRIYPFVPLPDTEIAKEIKAGKVQLVKTDTVVDRMADMFIECMKNEIPVIRVGLPQSDDIPDIYPHNLFQVVVHRAIEKLAEQGETEFIIPEIWTTSFNMAKRNYPKIKMTS